MIVCDVCGSTTFVKPYFVGMTGVPLDPYGLRCGFTIDACAVCKDSLQRSVVAACENIAKDMIAFYGKHRIARLNKWVKIDKKKDEEQRAKLMAPVPAKKPVKPLKRKGLR